MRSEQIDTLERVILAALPADHRPTEALVLDIASRFRTVFPVPDDDFDALLRQLHARLAITMDLGTVLVAEDHSPWLAARKAEIDPYYWERFRIWLGRLRPPWPPLVVNTLDTVSDDILDLLGNPARAGAWRRRGLVVGDVQSGKTAAYTALAAKAADAGFRLVILLTGTLESLRRQTQERLDEGFVGLDSSEMLQQPQVRNSRAVGVGVVDQRRTAGVFTSRSRDFSRQLMTQLGFRLDSFQEPVLVVVKKNHRVLENLEVWLRSYNAGPDGKIGVPLLLIDDEADSASINTSASAAPPTSINERIRTLLALFHRSSYVGFTATPFANVFIDPDTEVAMLGDDLFPRDYIYTLEPPSNYFGPVSIFGVPDSGMLRWIDDAEPFFPQGEATAYHVAGLPFSLQEAMRSFVLTTAMRDLRQEGATHRSMLVNVSRFTAVQDQVAALLEFELRDLQRDIRNYSKLAPAEALQISSLAGLYRTWEHSFSDAEFSWLEVQEALHESVQPIMVRAVNQRSGAASLDYKSHKENGLRVIAVGGNSLSRGLTLEGLSTSYFYRNSQMYDTLLQMGRWFGYREGYGDLCRLWLTEEAAHWYRHITLATEELRREFKRMRRLEMTPRDFGLKVRAHPHSLLITARNKMRRAETIVRDVCLSGEGVETARLRSNPAVIRANFDASERFIDRLIEGYGPANASRWGSLLWKNVGKQIVSTFLTEFETHPLNHDFQALELGAFLEATSERTLQYWDVAIPNGGLPEESVGALQIRPSERKVLLRRDTRSILVSGASARVGSRGVEREGLEDTAYDQALASYEGPNPPDSVFREFRLRPLLLLYFVRGYTRAPSDAGIKGEKVPFDPDGPPLVAIGLSFPVFDDSGIAGRVEYKVNTVEWRSLFDQEVDDDGDEDDEPN